MNKLIVQLQRGFLPAPQSKAGRNDTRKIKAFLTTPAGEVVQKIKKQMNFILHAQE